jgi:hypothetical protein
VLTPPKTITVYICKFEALGPPASQPGGDTSIIDFYPFPHPLQPPTAAYWGFPYFDQSAILGYKFPIKVTFTSVHENSEMDADDDDDGADADEAVA